MPKTTKGGQPRAEELPGTLRRSPRKAQRTFAKAHDSAAEQYGDEERANRVAYNAVRHQFQKVGDHWEPKGTRALPASGRRTRERGRTEAGPLAAST